MESTPTRGGSPFEATAFLATLTSRPGVYRLFDASGQLLYVGKAKDLHRRVKSYFQRSLDQRRLSLVAQIARIEVTVTRSEAEALLLENNLIKSHQPRYNVLLKDDKGYPYLHLSSDQPFPRLSLHRGSKTAPGRYFGPYPSRMAVRETLFLLQKFFRIRPCPDAYFKSRTRACLQHQIQRCSGPCVALISAKDYRRDVDTTIQFLEGRTTQLVESFEAAMQAASERLEFEQAALFRDRLIALRKIQERQHVEGESGDLDILACALEEGVACLQLFVIRGGRNLGNRAFFPQLPTGGAEGLGEAEVVSAFLSQHYLEQVVPAEILVSHLPPDQVLLETVLSNQAGQRVCLTSRVRGERARWLELAVSNARIALASHLAGAASYRARLAALGSALALPVAPHRMECFDVSHTAGESAVTACVVFNEAGPCPAEYRRFNVTPKTGGDDYEALREALTRRYRRIKAGEVAAPDILLVDGGKGQLAVVEAVLQTLAVTGISLVGVAKGPTRKAGFEQLFLPGQETAVRLAGDSAALHLIQQIRDEAHRFAISGHRQRRAKRHRASALQAIPGVGAVLRQRLLRHFGGLREITGAGIEDLARVDGISDTLAKRIYAALHGED